jgi:hypothetical protein
MESILLRYCIVCVCVFATRYTRVTELRYGTSWRHINLRFGCRLSLSWDSTPDKTARRQQIISTLQTSIVNHVPSSVEHWNVCRILIWPCHSPRSFLRSIQYPCVFMASCLWLLVLAVEMLCTLKSIFRDERFPDDSCWVP